MRYRTMFHLSTPLLALLAFALLVPPAGAGEPPSYAELEALLANEQVVGVEVSALEQRQAAELWTRERMLAAQPLPFPAALAGRRDGRQPLPNGPMGTVPGGLPDPDAVFMAQTYYPHEWLPSGAPPEKGLQPALPTPAASELSSDPTEYTYPPPYTFYRSDAAHMWKHYPWMTMGKLFFTIPSAPGSTDGETYSYCSASVAVNRALWTAGHCVYTPGVGWHTDMTFVPAYRNGHSPFGVFTVFAKATLGGWVSGGNQAYDIGMAAVQDIGGRTIAQWVGWLGFKYNATAKQHWHSNGYPNEFASGEILYCCEASLSSRWARSGPDPVGMGCRMRWGSSGGPWVTKFMGYSAGAKNYVNSVVSGSPDPSNYHEFFGPYFGGGARNLYNWGLVQ